MHIKRLLAVLLLGACVQPALSQSDVTSSGTGFLIISDGWFVTNAHVVKDCAKVTIAGLGQAQDIKIDAQNDLAAFHVPEIKKDLQSLHLSSQRTRLGEDVVAFGYPLASILSDSIKVTTGNVNSLVGLDNDTRYMQVSTPVQPGNSGGPLVNRSGKVLGVITAQLGSGFTQATGVATQNVNFAIHSTVLGMFLQSRGIEFQTSDEKNELSTADLAELISPSVLTVFCRAKEAEAVVEVKAEPEPRPVTTPSFGRNFHMVDNYDIIGFDYATLPGVSQSACELACSADLSCRATTYNKRERFCFLKNDAAIAIRNRDATASIHSSLSEKVLLSDFSVQTNRDSIGGDYAHLRQTGFVECFAACGTDSRCRAFSYIRAKRSCWLKDHVGMIKKQSGVDFGSK